MQSFELSRKCRKLLWLSLLFMLVARVITNTFMPLADTSEARYSEMARKMVEVGNWVTPLHDYGVPFWGKPPLSTWLAAGSMKLFGVNEFAVRLPSMLFGIATLLLVWSWVAPRRGRDFALASTVVLGSMVLFFIGSGSVMTDASLAFCTTLAMISFWQALHTEQKCWGYLFFAAIGVGLLAKGPIAGVLTFLAILPWIALRRNWRLVRQSLPWVRGTLLMLLIAMPWYLVAEHQTPGFISYFILGEHVGRFLNAGWSGDKYGHAHTEALGMIWVYWLASASPWSFVVTAGVWRRKSQWRMLFGDDSGMISYLLLWSFTAMVFFTFAHNIIWPYALPALPAFAILAVELWSRCRSLQPDATGSRVGESIGWCYLAASILTPAALLIMAGIYADEQQALLKSSQRGTALYYMQVRPSQNSGLYYYRRRYYSGEFYSAGKAAVVTSEDMESLRQNNVSDFLVIQESDFKKLPDEQRAYFRAAKKFDKFIVLEEVQPSTMPSLSSSH